MGTKEKPTTTPLELEVLWDPPSKSIMDVGSILRYDIPSERVDQKIPGMENPPKIAKVKLVRNPVLAFKSRPGTGAFEQPEYDLAECGRIEDVEGYVQRAMSLKESLMFKEGWEFIGKNPDTIRYVKARFEQMDAATGVPHRLWLRQAGASFVRVHNNFLLKVRDAEASGGKPRKLPSGRELDPVAAYFVIPASTVRFKRNDSGLITRYRQALPSGQYKEFPPENVVHMYYHRKDGFLVGTPILVSVKDDIRALRRIEENIEMLVYQHLFPLFHYTIGTEKAPCKTYPDGTTEVDIVKQELEITPSEGAIVTPERHAIEAVGVEGRALRAEGYIEHFKRRIFAGLGVSSVDMGDGSNANRSTADNLSRNLVDEVKGLQDVFEEFVNEYIVKELLLESTFEDPTSEENIVRMKFTEIDLDAKIKVENHALNAYKGYAITQGEMRRKFGFEPLSEEEIEDTFWKRQEEPKALISAVDEPFLASFAAVSNENTSLEEGDQQQAQVAASKAAAEEARLRAKVRPGPRAKSKNGGQAAAAAADQPSNQHGKKAGPEKRKSGMFEDSANIVTSWYSDLESTVKRAIDKNYFSIHYMRIMAEAAGTEMKKKLNVSARVQFRQGCRAAGAALTETQEKYPLRNIQNRIDRIINRLIAAVLRRAEDVIGRDTRESMMARITAVFDSLRYRTDFIYDSELPRAYNYGLAIGLKSLGEDQAQVVISASACEDCQKHSGKISLQQIGIADVPGFHPNCTCTLAKIKKEGH